MTNVHSHYMGNPVLKAMIVTEPIKTVTKGGHLMERPSGSIVCSKCGRLLAKPNKDGEVAGQIKCQCGTINEK